MRIFLTSLSASALAVFACSSSSSVPSGGGDAAADAPVDDAGQDSGGNIFPGVDSGTSDGNANTPCAQLKAKVDQLGLTARQCCPSCAQSQCNAATDGPCCPITVSASSTQPVDDYDQAVKAYKAQCNPDCSRVICDQTTPSNVCDGTGSTGTCQ